ncbi:hypothetical protein CC2G_005042 [Coprinopsis cinerea AmutBmut pab1-1]|nr:hypothetical protein CC2G_005042 [Coprinopsis cinerea AmutBmut pab1-1]
MGGNPTSSNQNQNSRPYNPSRRALFLLRVSCSVVSLFWVERLLAQLSSPPLLFPQAYRAPLVDPRNWTLPVHRNEIGSRPRCSPVLPTEPQEISSARSIEISILEPSKHPSSTSSRSFPIHFTLHFSFLPNSFHLHIHILYHLRFSQHPT